MGQHHLAPEFGLAASTWEQLKGQIDAGTQIGLIHAAEVTLARSSGIPVKAIAAYFGDTTARIYVAADGPIKAVGDLNGKRIGIVSNTTSFRTVMFMNKRLSVNAEPVPLGSLANNLSALRSNEIDAFYSAEGSPLTLVDAGELVNLLSLSEIYPQPYTAVVAWASDDLIASNPDLVQKFVRALLEIVGYLKRHPEYAAALYIKRTGASTQVADKAVASLNQILCEDGCGSGTDLAAAMAGNWQFIVQSGAAPQDITIDIDDAVDASFLPTRTGAIRAN